MEDLENNMEKTLKDLQEEYAKLTVHTDNKSPAMFKPQDLLLNMEAHPEFDERGDVLRPVPLHRPKSIKFGDLTASEDGTKEQSRENCQNEVLEPLKPISIDDERIADDDISGKHTVHNCDQHEKNYDEQCSQLCPEIFDGISDEKYENFGDGTPTGGFSQYKPSDFLIFNGINADSKVFTSLACNDILGEHLNGTVNEISSNNDTVVEEHTALDNSSRNLAHLQDPAPSGSFADSLEGPEESEYHTQQDYLGIRTRTKSEIPRLSTIVEKWFGQIPDCFVTTCEETELISLKNDQESAKSVEYLDTVGRDKTTTTNAFMSNKIDLSCEPVLTGCSLLDEEDTEELSAYPDITINIDVRLYNEELEHEKCAENPEELDGTLSANIGAKPCSGDHTYAGMPTPSPLIFDQQWDENANAMSVECLRPLEKFCVDETEEDREDFSRSLENYRDLYELSSTIYNNEGQKCIITKQFERFRELGSLAEDLEQEKIEETMLANFEHEEHVGQGKNSMSDVLQEMLIGDIDGAETQTEDQKLKENTVYLEGDPEYEECIEFLNDMFEHMSESCGVSDSGIEESKDGRKPQTADLAHESNECRESDAKSDSPVEQNGQVFKDNELISSELEWLNQPEKPSHLESQEPGSGSTDYQAEKSPSEPDILTNYYNAESFWKYHEERFSDIQGEIADSAQEKDKHFTTSDWSVEVDGVSNVDASPEYKYQKWSTADDFSLGKQQSSSDDCESKVTNANCESFTRIKYTRDYLMKFANCLLAYSFPESLRPFSRTMELPLKQLPVLNQPQLEPQISPPVNVYPGMDHILFYQNVTNSNNYRRISSKT